MSDLGTLKTILSRELGDSETINKNTTQREAAINDGIRLIYEFRDWKSLYENSDIQGVDGVFNIPRSMDKPVIIWYGKNQDYYWEYDFINQTDFQTEYPWTVTVTEYEGRQVLKMEEDVNRGHDVYNYTGTSTIGINDDAAREQIGQTFTANSTIEGVLLKLSKEGSPTGTLTVNIYATSGGLPTGSSLGSATININEIGTDEEYFWAKLSSAITPTTGDTYALTVTSSYSTSATDYIKWTYSTTSQITGSQVLYDGASWSAGTGDQVFVICDNYFKFQYTTKFYDLSASTDDSGLPAEFDRAIAKMAAGIILDNKGQLDRASVKFYGIGGSEERPRLNSAFGILKQLWTNKRFEAVRTKRRMKSVFESRTDINRRYPYEYFYNR